MTNEDEDKQRIVLITARLEGKIIQKLTSQAEWCECSHTDSFEHPENYRIKPNDPVYIVVRAACTTLGFECIEGVFKNEFDAIEYYNHLKSLKTYGAKYEIRTCEVK